MSGALFLCDGATLPAAWRGQWEKTDRLVTRGDRATANFAIQNLDAWFHGELDGRWLDFVRTAAYALAADESVSRGGTADPTLRLWRRRLGLVVPVNDSDFWNSPEVNRALRECLGFLSGDDWEFSFIPTRNDEQRQLSLGDEVSAPAAEADSVIPFSGGMDSLTAAAEELTAGRRPILLSHRGGSVAQNRRGELLDGLRSRFPGRTFGRISVQANRIGKEQVEPTQRSRSFLYASAAVVLAARIRAHDVLLSDNGWASVNPHINDQLSSTLATRSTHPTFIRLFNELACLVIPDAPLVRNPFWDQTRARVLERLNAAGGIDLLPFTNSCAAARNLPRATPHCGRCSQCIDRRFATLSAGFESADPGEGYKFDVFRGELPRGPVRALAVSYVRTARRIDALPDDGLFREFDTLLECLTPGHEDDDADAYVRLMRGQAAMVLAGLEEQLIRHRGDISRGLISPRSLLGILISDETGAQTQGDEFIPSDAAAADPAARPGAAAAASRREPTGVFPPPLHLSCRRDGARHEVLVDSIPVLLTDQNFALLIRLVRARLEDGDGWLQIEHPGGDGLVETGFLSAEPDQAINRLRVEFTTACLPHKPTELFVRSRGQLRLATPGDLVTWDDARLMAITDQVIAAEARAVIAIRADRS